MRISDWSSDVCSSDLIARQPQREASQRWQQFAQFVVIDWIHGVAGPRTRGVPVLIAGMTRGGGVYSLPGEIVHGWNKPAPGASYCCRTADRSHDAPFH